MRSEQLKFVDLFAGLGGFHIALSALGHRCVLASEVDRRLADIYSQNFGITPGGDIRGLVERDLVPAHDILCAGFPCQPFSKAGEQQGFDCSRNGDLFDYVMRIIKRRMPRYVILENVPNLKNHNNGGTWQELRRRLDQAGYDVDAAPLSPHHFGVPQIRERIFIVASRKNIRMRRFFAWPKEDRAIELAVDSILDKAPNTARPLQQPVLDCLSAWQAFLDKYPKEEELPGNFPYWSMEWGATYPYENITPHAIGPARLRRYLGSHGRPLTRLSSGDLIQALPSYARYPEPHFPDWKVRFIRLNREFYAHHKGWIDKWMPQIFPFPSSRQKLEWNIKGGDRNLWQYIIQLRASGVRVKRRTTAPSLVAMTSTQVPIVGWEKRYMTARECARLQSMGDLRVLPPPERAYKALGNAVNAHVAQLVAEALIGAKVMQSSDGIPARSSAAVSRTRATAAGRAPQARSYSPF